ncbi:MAG: adenine phosphoribosyltransferase [Hyphomonadaceae bacterium]
MDIRESIRAIPGYPKPGIIFRDITTLLTDRQAFQRAVQQMATPYSDRGVDKVAAIEARGFIFGGAVAHLLSAAFVPVRKRGKLPWRTISQEYQLEYGTDVVELHEDALTRGERVLLIDDLIATGGTAEAAVKLIERLGGDVIGASFVVDLPDLGGADRLRTRGLDVQAVCAFEGH